jgi:hypothetical protein
MRWSSRPWTGVLLECCSLHAYYATRLAATRVRAGDKATVLYRIHPIGQTRDMMIRSSQQTKIGALLTPSSDVFDPSHTGFRCCQPLTYWVPL